MNPALKDGESTWEGFPPLPNSEVNHPSLKDWVSGAWIKAEVRIQNSEMGVTGYCPFLIEF